MDSSVLPELPPEVEDALTDAQEVTRTQLKAFSTLMAKLRDEAVSYRQSSGLESVWQNCEEAYLGLDDLNRDQFAAAKWGKPTSMEGPVTTSTQSARGGNLRSTVLPRITARYVDAGAAKVSEILLPMDDKAFSLSPTPVPELVKGKADLTPMFAQDGVTPLTRPPKPDEMASLAHGTTEVPLTTKDLVEEAIAQATEKAKKAERRIYDWMVESHYPAEMRKVIFDAARIGVGVLKGPFPDREHLKSLSKVTGPDGKPHVMLQFVESITPHCEWKDPWNIFPDPACGEDIHQGDHLWERVYFTPKQVRDLEEIPGYHKDLLEEVLKQGPSSAPQASRNPHEQNEKHRFEGWHFHGSIKRDDFTRLNPKASESIDDSEERVHAIVTMINDTVVYATLHPLDSGSLPYHAVPWRRRPGSWAGVGVAEQMMVPQRIITAATRAMMNDAGRSGPQIVTNTGLIEPLDEEWVIYSGKQWGTKGELEDVRKAFTIFDIPATTDKYLKIIEFALRLAEESTSIPLITQGQSGPTTPDTYGAAQLQNNNANQLLRSIGYAFDDYITSPIVNQLYEWLLLDPDVPEDEKGDFQVNAHGSAALVERAIQDQALWQMGEMVIQNPTAFGVDPKRWFAELAKSKHLDPRSFQFSEEEQKKLAETPPPPPPQVMVAQIRAETEMQLAQLEMQADKEHLALEAQLAGSKTEVDRMTIQLKQKQLETTRELAILDYSNRRGISVEQTKARLAETVMKLTTQKQLAGTKARQVATPATEPPGRAPAGQAFAR